MRRSRSGQFFAVLGAALLAIANRLIAVDPGLARLILAGRGTLSVVLATVVAILVGQALHVPPIEFAMGITFSLMGPFLMREPTRRARQRTLLILVLPAAAITVATALLHGRGIAGDASFLVLVFACFLLHPRGPIMIGIGLVAVVTAYVGLFLELPPSTLPMQLASLLAAVPIIVFACFVALPMRPVAMLRRTVQAVQWRAAQVVHSAHDVTEARIEPARALAHLQRDLARLNEATLAADDQLALVQPDEARPLRAGLVEIELASARLIEALRVEKPGPRHAVRLLLHERRIRRGQPYTMPAALLEPGTLLAQLVELGHLVHALGVSASLLKPARETPPGNGLPPGRLAWRMATRVTLAAAIAMAAGMALSPQRWFWAVMTVYVVFLNARSRGDTIYRGLQRMGGTLLGIVSGLLLATLLAGDQSLQVAALIAAIFGMYYFFLVSYTIGIFCVTVMLGLLYGMLGAPLESLLILRLEEAAIGTASALLVAAFVFPTRTRDQVMRSGRGVLTALAAAVGASRKRLSGDASAMPLAEMRRVDRQVADLRLAMAPLTASRTLLRRSPLERPVPALLDCVHWGWVLASASAGGAGGSIELAQRASAIEHRLAGLAGVHAAQSPQATQGLTLSEEPGEVPTALDRLSASVDILAERLEIGALEGFAL